MLNAKSTLIFRRNQPITLWEMTIYVARRLVRISERLEKGGFCTWNSDAWASSGAAKSIAEYLAPIIDEARFLGLNATVIAAEVILDTLNSSSADEVAVQIEMLKAAFQKETEQISLFFIPAEKQEYFVNISPYGEQSAKSFPRANHEATEAGKCFATERYTACVFHLMRALEHGLRATALGLDLPEPTKGGDRNWGNMLRDIKRKIDTNNSGLKMDHKWQGERDFYEKAYAFLEGVRNPVRNSTMHVEADYDEQGAIDILNACGAFMRHIATKLAE